MSAKRESKQPVPSVMARLMGFEEISTQQPVQKKPRVYSENYLRRVVLFGVREKCSERDSFRLSIEEKDECNTIFQVLETLRRKHHSMPLQKRKVRSSSSEAKTEVIEPNHVSGDKKVQIDNIQKYLQKPNLEFTKKPSEPTDVDSNLKLEYLTVSQSSYASECRHIRLCRKFRRRSELGYVDSLKNVQNIFGKFSSGEPHIDHINKFLSSKFKSNNKACRPTTNIVLLKPNHGKADGALGNGLKPVRRSRFSREITRKMVHDISSVPTDEPSSENSGSGLFANESESLSSSRKSQFCCSDGSHAAREAKKQISERWRTTKRFQQVELAGLCNPDKPSKFGPGKQVVPDNGNVNFARPSGISSVRNLTRYRSLLPSFKAAAIPNTRTNHESLENAQKKSREEDFNQRDGSECFCSDFSFEKSQAIPYLESENSYLGEDDYVIQKELEHKLKKHSDRHKNQGREEDLSDEEQLELRNCSMEVDEETYVVKMSPSNHEEEQLDLRNCSSSANEEDSPSQIKDSSIRQEMSSGIFEMESVSSQFSGTDPESLMSFDEAYQPSPNSVLDSLYRKQMSSSSDGFKSVNAYLNGLHRQLELLKSETAESYSEGSSMAVSSDNEDIGEGSINDTEENECLMSSFKVEEGPISSFKVEESRDFSYLVDVLTEAGIQNKNLPVGFDTWHSQECPISFSIFETLEKKYGEQISWKRSERRLLFDRINSGLAEILQPSMGVLTCREPVARRVTFSHGQDTIEDEMWMLLVCQEKEASKESEKILGKDDGWLELGDDIREVGREIENSLIEELVADVSMEIFC
ncbi:hypothetical protein JCGZ_06601 [Jatropha curcas]|uniref:DUF4378 domain-containing protein n=1 Tax=Jatropha curcas TaxID=180498 RepID=A0A067LMP1_JATCU|nr:uncharacterized protein LOC105634737 [Jatropha curcas]KDP46090.1 hypothetical protein JCGZ_06601 [Jatropha curcas]